MTERDPRCEDVGDRPHRHPVPPEVPQRHDNCRDQSAVEDARRADAGPCIPAAVSGELVVVDDQQEQLGADERADDDPDAEIHDPVRIETARPRLEPARTAARRR